MIEENQKKSIFFICVLFGLSVSCDLQRKKRCEWTLEPDMSRPNDIVDGYVPVCAINRISLKQDCRLQIRLDFAKKNDKRKFKYVDMELESFAIPTRKISKITFCD